MDLARASGHDALIEKRAGERNEANAAEMLWKESVRRHNAKLRRERMAEWFEFYSRLAYSLRASAEEYERRAEVLLEEPGRGEGSAGAPFAPAKRPAAAGVRGG